MQSLEDAAVVLQGGLLPFKVCRVSTRRADAAREDGGLERRPWLMLFGHPQKLKKLLTLCIFYLSQQVAYFECLLCSRALHTSSHHLTKRVPPESERCGCRSMFVT